MDSKYCYVCRKSSMKLVHEYEYDYYDEVTKCVTKAREYMCDKCCSRMTVNTHNNDFALTPKTRIQFYGTKVIE